MDVIAEIKRLYTASRRYPDVFKDVRSTLTLLQAAEARILEGQKVAAEHDQAIERRDQAIAQANQAVKDLQALEASLEPKRREVQRKLFEIEAECDARHAERIGELADLDFELNAKAHELATLTDKLKALAEVATNAANP